MYQRETTIIVYADVIVELLVSEIVTGCCNVIIIVVIRSDIRLIITHTVYLKVPKPSQLHHGVIRCL